VRRKPGISRNSPWTPRMTSSVARIGADVISILSSVNLPGCRTSWSNRCASQAGSCVPVSVGEPEENRALSHAPPRLMGNAARPLPYS
jgi:hypothetical protein